MPDDRDKAVINFSTLAPYIITTEEYEEIEREVVARRLAGDTSTGDRLLATLLVHHRSRYLEAKRQNGNR